MIVSINQPAYLPWLGYFDRIAASDLHVVLDNVQFEKNSFINRNRVRTGKGWTWLTVPVVTSGRFGHLPINRVEVEPNLRWARKHWQTIEQSYARAPHFADHRAALATIYARPWTRLIDLIDEMTCYLLENFAIRVPLVNASNISTSASKSALILELCRHVGASVYLSGLMGRDYLDEASFADAGVDIVYQDYRHPVYRQTQSGFEPYMAAIDLLFMQGLQAGSMLRTTARLDLTGDR